MFVEAPGCVCCGGGGGCCHGQLQAQVCRGNVGVPFLFLWAQYRFIEVTKGGFLLPPGAGLPR